MAARKSAKKSTKKSARSSHAHASRNGNRLGVYTVPQGNVSIAIPPFWVFRQTNDDLQLVSPSGEVSIIVNAYSRNPDVKSLDAREYLNQFLQNVPKQSRVQREPATKAAAAARYRDTDGNSWWVQFATNGKMLVLSELSSTAALTVPEAKAGIEVVKSLKLKATR